MTPSLDSLFNPRAIAIVGASPKAGSIAAQPLRRLMERGYPGTIYPVNAKYADIAGIRCYPSIADLPHAPDVAVLVISAARVPDALRACGEKGIPFAIVISSGFAETGTAGRALQRELVEICRSHGIRMVGPNCQGVLNVGAQVAAGFGPVLGPDYGVQPGKVSFVTQSGGFGFAAVSLCAQAGVGFRHIVSTGNEADLGTPDFMHHFVRDPGTRVLAAYIEGLQDGRRFATAIREALAADKPVLVWKVGNTEVGGRAASSHTANLAGNAAIYEAVLGQAGAILIDDACDLVDFSRAFLRGKRPAGNRVAIFSASGGAGVLASDHCIAGGLEVAALSADTTARLGQVVPDLATAQNPIDVMGGVYADPERLARALRILAQDPSLDSLVVINPLREGRAALAVARAIVEVDQATSKPLLVTWTARADLAHEALALLREHAVPCFETPVRCARSLSALTTYSAARAKLERARREPAASRCAEAARQVLRAAAGTQLTEHQSKALLAAYGLPITRERLSRSVAEACGHAREIGYPVALKVQSAAIAHKTEAGGVRLNIATEQELEIAYAQLMESVRRSAPDAALDGVLVQEMVRGGYEAIVGVLNDAAFGPVVMFGMGGIYAEVMDDVAFRAAPLTREQAQEMVRETRFHRILAGARGRSPADVDALVDLIVSVGELAADLEGEIAELDINPVAVLPMGQGVRVLDALVTRAAPAKTHS